VLSSIDIGVKNHVGMKYVIANNLGPRDIEMYHICMKMQDDNDMAVNRSPIDFASH
jgi:hypothetical protein